MDDMSVLSDQDLLYRLEKVTMRIDPFREKNLTSNGYDLSVMEVYFKAPEAKVTLGAAYLESGSWCLISTEEYIEIPPDLTAQLWLRTSYIRKGLIGGFGKVDAGFKGTLTISVVNMGPEKVAIPIGDRICQICFEELSSIPGKLYAERSGTYQGQRGVTLAGGKKAMGGR